MDTARGRSSYENCVHVVQPKRKFEVVEQANAVSDHTTVHAYAGPLRRLLRNHRLRDGRVSWPVPAAGSFPRTGR